MNTLSSSTRSLTPRRVHLLLAFLSSFSLLALLLVASPAQAEDPEEAYVPIYSQIQDAESLEAGGQTARALTNYQHAAVALQALQRKYPDWNTKLVSVRLNRLAEKITALSEQPAVAVQPTTNAPSAAHPSKPAASSAPATVKLLDAGAEPRKVLRLHPTAGDKQTVEMAIKMKMETKVGEMAVPAMDLPPITMMLNVGVKNISPEGDITYEMAVSDVAVAEDAGGGAAMAQLLKASLGGAKGVTGTGTVTDRGVAKAVNVKLAKSADAQSRQVMGQMSDLLSGAFLALPEEAVGAGAKWEARRVSKMQGASVNNTEIYELVSVEGDRLKMKVTDTQNAANQKMQAPGGGRAGGAMTLTRLSANVTGESTCDLGQLMPSETTAKEHMELTLSLGAPQKQTMSQKMDLELHLQSK